MASSGMLRRVALVKTDVSEELSASFIRVTKIGELGTTLAVTSNRATQRNIPEDAILQSTYCSHIYQEELRKTTSHQIMEILNQCIQ
jgi:hypothetical protein